MLKVNGHLEISASASAFQYKYSFLNSINSLHVISNKVATYRLEACDFVRKCFTKISRRKFSDNLKRVTVKNPYGKTSVLEFLFNEIAEINSELASLVKKSLHQRHFPVNISELSALLQESLTYCILQGWNFIEKLFHHILFSQNIVY